MTAKNSLKKLTKEERFDRLERMIAEGNVLREQWTDGEERACLLAALSPEAGEAGSAAACPAKVLPPWFAHLTPSMDDYVSLKYWPKFIRHYASAVRCAANLNKASWLRIEYAFRADVVREAMRHTDDKKVIETCEAVVALCDGVANGGKPNIEKL